MKRSRISYSLFKAITTALIMAMAISILPFEEVRAATTWIVTKTADTDDGVCDADCSLREALFVAEDGDGIEFDSSLESTTVTLTSATELDWAKGTSIGNQAHISIIGPGADLLTIDGNNTSCIFDIHTFNSISLSGVTLANGASSEEFIQPCGGYGGAIRSNGSVTIDHVIFISNESDYDGGAIYIDENVPSGPALTLTITNSTFDANFSDNGMGDNSGYGGAISTNSVDVTISGSTFSNNRGGSLTCSTGCSGGAIDFTTYDNGDATLNIYNSTFHGNHSLFGGAVQMTGDNSVNQTAYASILNVTFAGNSTYNGGTLGSAISILNLTDVSVKNVIFVNNSGDNCFQGSGFTTYSGSSNLSDDASCSVVNATQKTTAQIGLGTLSDNGGPTQTMALNAGSAAINSGDNTVCDDIPGPNNLDQRGNPRPTPSGAPCDIGAYEYSGNTTYVVTNDIDTNDGSCDISDCSLREAIIAANGGSSTDRITFAANSTITLSSQLPAVTTPIIITGNGAANTIIQANAAPNTADYRVFEVNITGNLTLNNMTVRNGRCNVSCDTNTTSGGGIYNSGTLIISNSTISNNRAVTGVGGGIYNSGTGTLTMIRSTISGDPAIVSDGGGGLGNNGTATLKESTFSSNRTNNAGGAIYNNGTLTIANSTFTGNYASANVGGGIYNAGTLNLYNSTMSENTSNSGAGDNLYNQTAAILNISNTIIANSATNGDCVNNGGTVFGGSNLIESSGSNACGLVHNLNNNIIGVDPELDTLTGSPAYLPLGPSSPAIDEGNDSVCTVTPVSNASQNGNIRPEGAHCDIGAFEFDKTGPVVATIFRVDANPTALTSVDFTVLFSESVTGVDITDFILTTTGVSITSISGVSGSGSNYTVTVDSGVGNGTIRLDLIDDDTIQDEVFNLLTSDFTSGEIYTVDKQPIFSDVPVGYWANSNIERLYVAGITGGCSSTPLLYCPENLVTRDQMAVFLERGIQGASFFPPDVLPTFGDTAGNFAEDWIEALRSDGITSGCSNENYCPNSGVTRAQMAIFLERSMHGTSFTPPDVTPTFTDTAGNFAEDWIEALKNDGITSGCGLDIYCPDAVVTRAQMAVFLVKAFGLP